MATASITISSSSHTNHVFDIQGEVTGAELRVSVLGPLTLQTQKVTFIPTYCM